MEFLQYLKAGERTACTPSYFVESVKVNRAPLFDCYQTVGEMVNHFDKVFESYDRWEFIATDAHGKYQAVLVFIIEDYDLHKGCPVIVPVMAYSNVRGALARGYKVMKQIARENGIQWLVTQRGKGSEIVTKYHEVKGVALRNIP